VGGIIALPRLPVHEGDRFPLDLRLRQRPGLRKGISSSLAPRANGRRGLAGAAAAHLARSRGVATRTYGTSQTGG
jgi:hypothetical protein